MTAVIKLEGTVANVVQKAPFEIIKITTNQNNTAQVVEGAEFTAILERYINYYGSFEEAQKHIKEFAEDEYAIIKTRNRRTWNFDIAQFWTICSA